MLSDLSIPSLFIYMFIFKWNFGLLPEGSNIDWEHWEIKSCLICSLLIKRYEADEIRDQRAVPVAAMLEMKNENYVLVWNLKEKQAGRLGRKWESSIIVGLEEVNKILVTSGRVREVL